MSLDFYLKRMSVVCGCGHEHDCPNGSVVFSNNITHNLGKMFDEAGAYDILWHGDGKKAGDVVATLEQSLLKMKADPAHYLKFQPSNGWGLYANAVPWLKEVIKACKEYPDTFIECSR